jgi:uncharacterized membrane protein
VLSIHFSYLNETFLRVVFGVPVVIFVPGCALIATLFPGAKDIGGIERVALSFGLSVATVSLIGLALNYTPWAIRLDPVVVSLSLFTLCMCLVARYRRALAQTAVTLIGKTVTIPKSPTDTAVFSSLNPSVYSQGVTFTAIVSGSAGTAGERNRTSHEHPAYRRPRRYAGSGSIVDNPDQ